MPSSGVQHAVDDNVTIHRTRTGWLVTNGERHEMEDLQGAMVLADLLVEDLESGNRPPRPQPGMDEVSELRLMVKQLEHALHARVVIEQAIGVLAERQRLNPREAFERLRRVARSHGRRVHHLAREVVASVNDRAVPLPPELVPRRK